MAGTLPPYLTGEGRAGALDGVDSSGLLGWTLDFSAPGAPLRVILRAAGRTIAEATADRDRPDLDAATGLHTPCGFVLAWSDLDFAALAAAAGAEPDTTPELALADTGDLLPWLAEAPTLARLRDLASGEVAPTPAAPEVPATAQESLEAFLRARSAPVTLQVTVNTQPPVATPSPKVVEPVTSDPAMPEIIVAARPAVAPSPPPPPAPAALRPPARRPAPPPRPAARGPFVALRPSADRPAATRALDATVAARDLRAAAGYAAELEADPASRRDPPAALALSRYHHLAGNPARAAGVLRDLPPYPATEAATELAILHRLIEEDALDEAAARLAAIEGEEPPEFHGPRLRLAARAGDFARFGALLDDPRAEDLPDWQLVEATFRLTTPGRVPAGTERRILERLERMVEARGLDRPGIVGARIHVLLHGRRWAELGALFDSLARTPLGAQRDFQLRRLEYLAHSGQVEAADELYRDAFRDVPLSRAEGLAVIRLLGELGRWEEAGHILLNHVASGEGFGDAAHIALRVVRRAGLHRAVLDLGAGEGRETELGAFLTLVAQDAAIARGADPARTDAINDIATHLCTNRRYFLSALTFLCSFLGQSPQVGGRVFAFLDDDVPRLWHGAVAMVAARFEREVEVVPEPDFVPPAVEHRTGYGFFAGGSVLSRAAYFRLYAARWLLDRDAFRRIAYFDTDTVCRGDLSGLFALDMGPDLVAAAAEDLSLDVVNAATRNGLDPRAYFNSGVLLFRADAPDLRAPIEEAIRVSEEEPERLNFHDQCALNIAFQGRVAPLPRRYNFFLRPSRPRNGHIEDGLVLHYLDRPKPWDIAFDRGYREEWRVWSLLLSTILPPGLYRDILAAANRD